MKIEQFGLPNNLLCFSHLRWDFVFQRPQHLMSRFAKEINVFFLEEPVYDSPALPTISAHKKNDNLTILIPHLPAEMQHEDETSIMRSLLSHFLDGANLKDWIFWYYTPMSLRFSDHFSAGLTVFDCMDELSAFDFAPKDLVALEMSLLKTADIVFTGGHSLHEVKRHLHDNIHVFPSSIDKEHFSLARTLNNEPEDQKNISGIKLGFIGVIDERFNAELIRQVAEMRPEWQLILLGPIVKISVDSLPSGPNLHYLGQKSYDTLPSYLSGWNIALIPFAINNSTRFISPTKTPEYLAAGLRVVSTPINDVIKPYGIERLVEIAANADEFIIAIEKYLSAKDNITWLKNVDLFLKDKSWDNTFEDMKKNMIWSLQEINKLLAS
ncbi:glycosyltransferase family 1 protein [Pedobacter frigidisoli]|uniref:Glycosyltransferase family 1 protein n=1 Tax=Pedobacter frigidisoli TaxID=2530455 RepID=A0A4R0P0A9_9SPHI|nr:glycosyltransferase family 1 protein [Pedobacter frigidisoli]TCD08341.1 glycosyltransferase family 1 protein [Pedobacter frigidisoli]